MRIIITGGLGFIGQHLSRKLLASGHTVIVIDSLSTQIHGHLPLVNVQLGITLVRMDIRHIASHHELLEGADAIFHLAAETGTAQSMYKMTHYTQVNCEGTTALLEAIAKCSKRPKHIILTSSRSVYGEGAYTYFDDPGSVVNVTPRKREDLNSSRWELEDETGRQLIPFPTPETFPFAPGSIYAATKAAQELLLISSSIALGIETTIFRLQNVYGEGQSLRNPYTGIISIFFNRAHQGLPILLYEDGLESRDFIHIGDVIVALEASLDTKLPNGIVINIGSGVPTTVSLLAETLLRVCKLEVPIEVTGQYRIGDIRHCFADLARAKKYIGFTPRISLEDGLNSFCSWARSQPVHEDMSIKAETELKERGLSN